MNNITIAERQASIEPRSSLQATEPDYELSIINLPEQPMTHTPPRDESDPLVSIVIPCLNEEICVGECVDWCHEGLQAAGVSGEILIVDNGSTDRSPEIAAVRGAVPARAEAGTGASLH